jgi:hypothetical protein
VRATATYPLLWPTKDNLDSVSLADQAAFEAFYAAAFAKVRGERDTGAAVKAAILAATTTAQITAALNGDTRP